MVVNPATLAVTLGRTLADKQSLKPLSNEHRQRASKPSTHVRFYFLRIKNSEQLINRYAKSP